MKRITIIFLITFLTSVSVFSKESVWVSVTGNYLMSSDSGFKDIYGNGHIYPEIKAGIKIFKSFYFWAGYGFLSASGQTLEYMEEEASTTQQFLSAGVGYKIPGKLGIKVETGLFNVHWKEEAMDEENSGSAIGFRFDSSILFGIGKSFFFEITAGYLHASDSVDDISIKLGGFKGGIGIGIKF